MKWEMLISPFTITPVISVLMGNFSLGAIAAGLTGLIWGNGSGSLFVSITTTILVILTGNINLEIIFLYALSLAYLAKESNIFNYINKRFLDSVGKITVFFIGDYKFLHSTVNLNFVSKYIIPYYKLIEQKFLYFVLFLFSISLVPLWRKILGLIPAGLLNELNISGGVLVIAGLLLFVIRGKLLLKENSSKEDFFEFFLVFFCSVLGLLGKLYLIPIWVIGIFILEKPSIFLEKLPIMKVNFKSDIFNGLNNNKTSYFLLAIILFVAVYAANLLLPIGFIAGVSLLLLLLFLLLVQQVKQLPVVEMVYISMLIGIVASRLGLLL